MHILIILSIRRAGARVVVGWVPHAPKMGSRRREIGNLLRVYFRSCSTQKSRYQCYFAEYITRSTNGRRPVPPSYLKLDLLLTQRGKKLRMWKHIIYVLSARPPTCRAILCYQKNISVLGALRIYYNQHVALTSAGKR